MPLPSSAPLVLFYVLLWGGVRDGGGFWWFLYFCTALAETIKITVDAALQACRVASLDLWSNEMRNEGDVTFYTVEMNGYKGTRWHGVGDVVWAKIPSEIRHKDCPPYSGKQAEPFQSYSASGKVWQKTGCNGLDSVGPATEAMMLLAQYNSGIEFRVVEERRVLERKQIAKLIIGDSAP